MALVRLTDRGWRDAEPGDRPPSLPPRRGRARWSARRALVGVAALVGAIVFAGHRGSVAAGPGSGLTPPAGWKALPSLATAARDAAKSGGLVVDNAEAWGETARGCYGAWLALAGSPARPAKLADDLVQGIQAEPALAPITLADVVKPAATTDTDVLGFSFAKAPYHGKLRARLVKDGHVTALVCFWNEREPAACEAACAQLLGGLQ